MSYRKLCQLEKYKLKGWLDFGDKRINSLDRLQAGKRLWMDFMKSGLWTSKAINLDAVRVDGGNMKEIPESVALARQKFNQAMLAVPEYAEWYLVREIVLYDHKVFIKKTTSAQYNHEIEMMKEDLCRGLDKLAYHYGVTVYKPKIVSYTCPEAEFVETKRRYEIEL